MSELPKLAEVAIKNQSQQLADARVKELIKALQKQVSVDVAQHWGADAKLELVAAGATVPSGVYTLECADASGKEDAGNHAFAADGSPWARVHLRPDDVASGSWTTTVSHELIEMLVNPQINRHVHRWHPLWGNLFYAREIADPVSDEASAYVIDGFSVSSFVLPSWFDEYGRGPFDRGNQTASPFQPAETGFAWVWAPAVAGWTSLYADDALQLARYVPSFAARRAPGY